MIYCKITDGVVTNRIIGPLPEKFSLDDYVQDDEAQIGWEYVGGEFIPPEEILEGPQPPGSPRLSAAAFNLTVVDYDILGLNGGYNIGGAIYFGPGEYLLFFIEPIELPYAALVTPVGDAKMTVTQTDFYSMFIQSTVAGELADPEGFSIQVFTL